MNEEGQIGDEPPSEDTRQEDWSQQPPQQQQEQPQPQQYQSQRMPPQQPGKPFLQKMADDWLPMFVIIGLIFLLVGSILINAGSYSDDADTEKDVRITGRIIQDIGVFLIAMVTLVAGALRDDLSKWMRVALVLFALVLIIVGYFNIGVEFGFGSLPTGPEFA